jgi:hypothetical protein
VKTSRGSILLLVAIVTGILSVLMLGWWRRSSLAYEIICEREVYYKYVYLTEILFSYSIPLFEKNNNLSKIDTSFVTRKLFEKENLNSVCIVSRQGPEVLYTVTLLKDNKPIKRASRKLVKRKKNEIVTIAIDYAADDPIGGGF